LDGATLSDGSFRVALFVTLHLATKPGRVSGSHYQHGRFFAKSFFDIASERSRQSCKLCFSGYEITGADPNVAS